MNKIDNQSLAMPSTLESTYIPTKQGKTQPPAPRNNTQAKYLLRVVSSASREPFVYVTQSADTRTFRMRCRDIPCGSRCVSLMSPRFWEGII